MGFMESGEEIQGSVHTPPWMDQTHSSFPSLTGTKNTNWESTAMHMSVSGEAIRKARCRFNNPLGWWGLSNPPIHHADRFHTYRNYPNKWDPDVAERTNKTIKEYAQRTSMMGGIRFDKDSQGKQGCDKTPWVLNWTLCNVKEEGSNVQRSLNTSKQMVGYFIRDPKFLNCGVSKLDNLNRYLCIESYIHRIQ